MTGRATGIIVGKALKKRGIPLITAQEFEDLLVATFISPRGYAAF